MNLHKLKMLNYIGLALLIGLMLLMQKTEGVWDTVITVVIIAGVLFWAVLNWFFAKCPHCGARQKELKARCWRCKRPLVDGADLDLD